ncbi:hypothetical protein LLG95_09520 [bacterium]|nr:hypothetical protein [bacterium]
MRIPRLIGLIVFVALAIQVHAADAPRPAKIVYSSNKSGPWRIWVVSPDGKDAKQLSAQDGEGQDVDPVFSADAKSIVYTSTRGGKPGIWRMNADGAKPERLCDGDQAEISPDGKKLALRKIDNKLERLYVRDLKTGKETLLSPADWPHCSGPAWSPDGKTIAFAARWDAGNGVYLVPAAGGKPVKIYDKQGACEPHYSPDGKRLVYETETHICTINPDGTKNRTVTTFAGVQRYGRFSPDGKWIVFCQGVSEQGPWELYKIGANGGTPTKLTSGASDMTPDWK